MIIDPDPHRKNGLSQWLEMNAPAGHDIKIVYSFKAYRRYSAGTRNYDEPVQIVMHYLEELEEFSSKKHNSS